MFYMLNQLNKAMLSRERINMHVELLTLYIDIFKYAHIHLNKYLKKSKIAMSIRSTTLCCLIDLPHIETYVK